jgi:CheY-like chemotaxis protein
MGQLNILIADFQNACAFFLKSVLAKEEYGVSISTNAEEAMRKIETGLFDMAICDLDFSDDGSFRFIGEVNDLVPGMPVIIVTDWALKYPLRSLDIFSVVDKPLRIAKILEVVTRARRAVTALEDSRTHKRSEVSLPVEVLADGQRVFCKATNLSSGGVQLESIPNNGRVRKMLGLAPILTRKNGTPVKTRIFFGRNKIGEFPSRLAYVERFRFSSPEQVGLSFTDLDKKQKEMLESYLASEAE